MHLKSTLAERSNNRPCAVAPLHTWNLTPSSSTATHREQREYIVLVPETVVCIPESRVTKTCSLGFSSLDFLFGAARIKSNVVVAIVTSVDDRTDRIVQSMAFSIIIVIIIWSPRSSKEFESMMDQIRISSNALHIGNTVCIYISEMNLPRSFLTHSSAHFAYSSILHRAWECVVFVSALRSSLDWICVDQTESMSKRKTNFFLLRHNVASFLRRFLLFLSIMLGVVVDAIGWVYVLFARTNLDKRIHCFVNNLKLNPLTRV